MDLLDQEACERLIEDYAPFIRKLARSRFQYADNEALVKWAVEHVLDGLRDNGWKRLRSFRGPGRFVAFLAVAVKNLLGDFSRKEFGRVRPPDWIPARGALWRQVYQMLCVEGASAHYIVEYLASTGRKSVSLIEEAIEVISTRVKDCGRLGRKFVPHDPEISSTGQGGTETGHAESHEYAPDTAILAILGACAFGAGEGTQLSADGVSCLRRLASILPRLISLTAEERLFLRLVYVDGASKVEAGRRLQWTEAMSYHRHTAICERLKKAFEDAGVAEDLKLLMGD